MASFLLALQFLTIIPVKIKKAGEQEIAASMAYFPLIGLLIGVFLAGVNALLYNLNFSSLASNVILVVALVVITAGLHLDGLADAADAFLSRKNQEEMLRIMHDSHIGVMGVLSLISIILLKISLLSSLNIASKIPALLLACMLSRWSAVWAMFLFPYARREGKAGVFMRGMNLKILIICTIVAIVCAALIWGTRGLVALLIISACTYAIGKFSVSKIGGITGDTLGATIELTEIVTLLVICAAGGGIWIS
ncbi:MAG: adenosylcobinamide-GDP ribazoletransferase [Candidatus Omnitrophica bacterium]|nr:adenosylcobinamide-GDP ribazoletransferase [Candidatus Omnitrophota bacterium]